MRFVWEAAGAVLALAATVAAVPMPKADIAEMPTSHPKGLHLHKRGYGGWEAPYGCWCAQTCQTPFRDWESMGCYDKSSDATQWFMHYKSPYLPADKLTKQSCWAVCKGQGTRYAAIGWDGKECWCGNVINGDQTKAALCDSSCFGDKSPKDCGGPGAVYTVFKDPSYKAFGEAELYTDGWVNQGCYWDDKERIVSYQRDASDNMSTGRCKGICASEGYPYMAVHGGKNCLCGGALRTGAKLADPGGCNAPCTGGPDEVCGGWYAVNVFYNEDLDNKEPCGVAPKNDTVVEKPAKTGEPVGETAKTKKTVTVTLTVTNVIDQEGENVTKIKPTKPATKSNAKTVTVFKTKTVTSTQKPGKTKKSTATATVTEIVLVDDNGDELDSTITKTKTPVPKNNDKTTVTTTTITSTSTKGDEKPAKAIATATVTEIVIVDGNGEEIDSTITKTKTPVPKNNDKTTVTTKTITSTSTQDGGKPSKATATATVTEIVLVDGNGEEIDSTVTKTKTPVPKNNDKTTVTTKTITSTSTQGGDKPSKATATATVTEIVLVNEDGDDLDSTITKTKTPVPKNNDKTTVVTTTVTSTSTKSGEEPAPADKTTSTITVTKIIVIETSGGKPIRTDTDAPEPTDEPNPDTPTITKTITTTSTEKPGGKGDTTATTTLTVTKIIVIKTRGGRPINTKMNTPKTGKPNPKYSTITKTVTVTSTEAGGDKETEPTDGPEEGPGSTTTLTVTKIIIIKTKGGKPIDTKTNTPKTGKPNPDYETTTTTVTTTSTQSPGGKGTEPTDTPEGEPDEGTEEPSKGTEEPNEGTPGGKGKTPPTLCIVPEGDALGGFEAPPVSCNDDKAEHKKGNHFRLFVGPGTNWPEAKCRLHYKKNTPDEITKACWNACGEQKKDCLAKYAGDDEEKAQECETQSKTCMDANDGKKHKDLIEGISSKYCKSPGPPFPNPKSTETDGDGYF